MDMLQSLELSTIFDTIPNPVFIKDEGLRFIFVNKAYEKMFKVKKRDVIGKQVIDLEYLPEQDRLFYQNEDMEVMTQLKTKHHIFSYLYKGKAMHTCLYWTSGFVQKNGNHGLVGMIVDINRQSKAIHTLQSKLRVISSEKEALAKKSKIDALTRLYVRSVFDESLQKLASRSKSGFSCIMVDIDHFKLVNDTFGHAVGDAVLAKTASVLKQCSRKRDIACRYGGEEFIILLPGSRLADAMKVAERIRRGVAKDVQLPDGKRVTISAGCSECIMGESGAALVQRADMALYAAKNSGRNRVCAA